MLLERLNYADDFPMNITISDVREDPLHYHLDIEILYVLKGTVVLKNGYCHYELHEGDIFTNSGHEVHSISAPEGGNVVAQIQLSTHYFSQYFPNLSKACYRTYSKKPSDKKHDRLRELLLQILLKYTTKGFNYKSECVYLMADTIKHLDRYFNLFAFEKDVVVGFDKGNQVAVERISRICQYIYQYYADNITLEDLSEIEHLNSFYLSHLIKSFTGMSFRDFLCFARVEWSEIHLLDSDAKISRIAREVGFSTTAYYKKYFEKWFHRTPEEHRAYYQPLIKSDLHPAVMEPLPNNRAVALIKRVYANYNLKKGEGLVISTLDLDVEVNAEAAPMGRFDKSLRVVVTADDFRAIGTPLLDPLEALAPAQVVILRQEQDTDADVERLAGLLGMAGLPTVERQGGARMKRVSAACDSIAYPLFLMKRCSHSEETAYEVRLRDTDGGDILQGLDGLMTAGGIRKSAFYFYQALSHVKGDIIALSNQYCVLRERRPDGRPVLTAIAYNMNEAVQTVCQRDADTERVRTAINDFKDEINVGMSIKLPPGMYTVSKYSLTREENIFAYMASMDFNSRAMAFTADCPMLYSGFPTLEIYPDDVRTLLHVYFPIKGAGIQMAVIKPMDS